MLYKMFLTFNSVDETYETIEMKAIEQYFRVVLFYAVQGGSKFTSVDETLGLVGDHSNKSY